MNRISAIAMLAAAALAVSGCATLGAAVTTELRSTSATAAHWFYRTSLPGNDPARWKAHVLQYQPQPVQLPWRVTARVNSELWIVPVCNGVTRWDAANTYQVSAAGAGRGVVAVSCPR